MPVILEIANRRSASGKVTENQVLLKWLQSEGVIAVTSVIFLIYCVPRSLRLNALERLQKNFG